MTTEYPMFLRVVAVRNMLTRLASSRIAWKNTTSSFSVSVAIKYIVYIPNLRIASPSSLSRGRNACLLSSRTIKSLNPFITADSTVTKMMDAAWLFFRLCYTCDVIPALTYRLCRSVRSATSGVTTTVTPSGEQNAGNMNETLLPPPVPITYTIGVYPLAMASTASLCWPSKSILLSFSNRRSLASSRGPSYASVFFLLYPAESYFDSESSAPNLKNLYY
ncbi:hypothetical protein BDP81DRAFT_437889 [Colletotrichum phormii]|uniref:Uncharacterized protein n=1 Tax=Colletotrichum phormii TaxID=359342 RepID=A0AAI9ZJM6_9PEZI|nr:uncharacterized protein BDP81DRAFT_437889 [Colletotrichum phormii]KAK1624576.1 hypothetical protein BDP81DRAFT_437889 [Colletotrichum phormii]